MYNLLCGIWHVIAAVRRMRLENQWSIASGSPLEAGDWQGRFADDGGKGDSLCYRGQQKAVSEIKVFLATIVTAGYIPNGNPKTAVREH